MHCRSKSMNLKRKTKMKLMSLESRISIYISRSTLSEIIIIGN